MQRDARSDGTASAIPNNLPVLRSRMSIASA